MFVPKIIIDKHAGPVYSCSYNGAGWLYSSAGDKYVARWNIASGEQDGFSVRLDAASYAIMASDEWLLIGAADGGISLIDTAKKTLLWNTNFHGKAIFSLEFSPHYNFFFAGDEDGQLLVFNLSGKLLVTLPLLCGKIRKIAADREKIFLAAQDGTIRVLSLPELNDISTWSVHQGGANCFVLENGFLLSGGKDGKLVETELSSGISVHSVPAHYQTIYGICDLDKGRFVTASRDKTIKVWDREQTRVVQRIEPGNGGHRSSVNGVEKLSENSFATWSDDKRIILWSEMH